MNTDNLLRLDTGISVNYRRWESDTPGAPPLVLVHGLASTLRIWDFVAPLLAAHFTVFAYDQRGHAGSDKPDGPYDLPTMLADLESLVSKLELHKPVLVGHSWGATLALAYAAAHPDNCAGVALIDGGVVDMRDNPAATWEKASEMLAPPDLSQYRLSDLVGWAQQGDLHHLPESYLEEFFGSMMDVQPDGTVRARLNRPHHMRILRAIWDSKPRELLERVDAPVLAVLAEPGVVNDDDVYLRAKQAGVAKIQAAHPAVKVVWIHDTIHDIPLHKPEELARNLLDFFCPPASEQ